MANYWDGMPGGKHNSDNIEVSVKPKKKTKKTKKNDNKGGN